MDAAKRAHLEAEGWQVGTVADFLGLTYEEEALVEIKLALSDALRLRREKQMSQADLAAKRNENIQHVLIGETNATAMSLDWLIRAMLAVGATPKEIGTVIASAEHS